MDKKQKKVIVIAAAGIFCVSALLLSGEKTKPVIVGTPKPVKVEKINFPAFEVPPADLVASNTTPPEKKDFSFDEGVQHEMMRVADIYEYRSQYPEYSVPLSSMQTDLLYPNQNHDAPRDYTEAGLPGSVSIKPTKFRYSTEEQIEAIVTLTGEPGFQSMITDLSFNITDVNHQPIMPMTILGDISNETSRTITLSLKAHDIFADKDINVSVVMNTYTGEQFTQTAPIKVVESIGKILGIGSIDYLENDVVVPIKVEVKESGYYQITGSLIDAESQQPVTFITAQEKIGSGRQTIDAKIHGSILKSVGKPGPYLLRGITFVRKGEKPSVKTKYGEPSSEEFDIKKFDLDRLSGAAFEDPMAQQRLAFLRSMGSENNAH